MAKRKALGKGLGALIPTVTPEGPEENKLKEVDISQISPNPSQPRIYFDEAALDELAASIKQRGILQPLVVRKHGIGFQVIVGERRWRAAQKAGLSKVPVIVQETDEDDMLELALIENIQRADLNPLEEAKAYALMVDRLDLTQEEVAERVGKNRSTVTNTLRLLKLHDDVKKQLLDGSIEMGHARALLALDDLIAQRELSSTIIADKLTVRQVEQKVKSLKRRSKPRRKTRVDPFITDAEQQLSKRLEAKVSIKTGKKGGKIEIKYGSEKDLQRLYDQFMDI